MTATGRWRPTIRVRLTLLFAGAVLLAGILVLIALNAYLGQVLDHQAERTGALEHASAEVHDTITSQLELARADTRNALLIGSLVLLGTLGVGAAGLGWLLAGRALAPLHDIAATARRVADRSLHERIARGGPDDEIKELADTIDAMLERLDRSFQGQRHFVANASHELRTPLAINRTLIEVALGGPGVDDRLRQLGTTLLAVNERNERLIDGLLTLASSDQRVTDSTPVDLADVARHVAAESQDAARSASVEIETELPPAPVGGDAVLLERLTQNLIDNAIRYNRSEGGWVRVATGTVDSDAYLAVENTGPEIPPYEVEALFEPFRRLSSAERLAEDGTGLLGRGAGLGLSIVRSVARAHGGEARASAREDGGLRVEVRIPALVRLTETKPASADL